MVNLLAIGGGATLISGFFLFLGLAFPVVRTVPIIGLLTMGIVFVISVGILSFGLVPNPLILIIPGVLMLLIFTTSGITLL